jgi:hypothetical protein
LGKTSRPDKDQGCQIFPAAACLNVKKYNKSPENKPNRWEKISNGSEIYKMNIKYTNIVYCKTLQNLPEFRFLV